MSDLARHAAAHVFVDDLGAPELLDDDSHHLGRVLRLRDGDEVTASDGNGSVRLCTWVAGHLEPLDEIINEPAPDPPLCVGFALTKGEKPEWTVQRLTELGIDSIAPFVSARSVVRWDQDKADRNVERLRRIAREAAMQSRRLRLPEIRPITSFAQVIAGVDPHSVALAEPGAGDLSAGYSTVLVGPEGGWSGEELGAVSHRVRVAEGVLRAETAAIAVGVLIAAVRARIVFLNAKSGLSARTL